MKGYNRTNIEKTIHLILTELEKRGLHHELRSPLFETLR